MSDFYISKAKQQFKVSDDAKFDDLEKELLMNAYAGTTKGQLKQHIRKKGKDFTFDHFDQEVKPGLMKQMSQNLYAATTSHLKNEHVGDIVKYTKTDKFLDADKMQIDDAIGVLKSYEANGVVPEKGLKEEIFYKKKPKKK